MNRVERTDTGSELYADPDLQLLNKKTARDLTKQVKNVYEIQQAGADWQAQGVSGLIALAAAIVLIALGTQMGFALGVGVALAVFGLYELVRAGFKYQNSTKSERVHEDATILRLSETVKKNQDQGQIEMADSRRRGDRRSFGRRLEPREYISNSRQAYIPAANAPAAEADDV